MQVWSLCWECHLEKEIATQSSILGFPSGLDSKASVCNAGDPGSIPGLGRSPGEGNGNPLQYSCLGNPMDRGACSDEAEMPLMRSWNPGWGWSQETWAPDRSMCLPVMPSYLPATQVWGGAEYTQRGARDSGSAAPENSFPSWTGTCNRSGTQRSCWASWLIVQILHLDDTTYLLHGLGKSMFLCAWFFLIK